MITFEIRTGSFNSGMKVPYIVQRNDFNMAIAVDAEGGFTQYHFTAALIVNSS